MVEGLLLVLEDWPVELEDPSVEVVVCAVDDAAVPDELDVCNELVDDDEPTEVVVPADELGLVDDTGFDEAVVLFEFGGADEEEETVLIEVSGVLTVDEFVAETVGGGIVPLVELELPTALVVVPTEEEFEIEDGAFGVIGCARLVVLTIVPTDVLL